MPTTDCSYTCKVQNHYQTLNLLLDGKKHERGTTPLALRTSSDGLRPLKIDLTLPVGAVLLDGKRVEVGAGSRLMTVRQHDQNRVSQHRLTRSRLVEGSTELAPWQTVQQLSRPKARRQEEK